MTHPNEFNVDESVKMLREALALAQSALHQVYPNNQGMRASETLQKLINECDRHRPLGVDGKHGRRHTYTCGCQDKGPVETWEGFKPPPGNLIHALAPNTMQTFCWYEGREMENPVQVTPEYRYITCPECLSIIDENT